MSVERKFERFNIFIISGECCCCFNSICVLLRFVLKEWVELIFFLGLFFYLFLGWGIERVWEGGCVLYFLDVGREFSFMLVRIVKKLLLC